MFDAWQHATGPCAGGVLAWRRADVLTTRWPHAGGRYTASALDTFRYPQSGWCVDKEAMPDLEQCCAEVRPTLH